MRNYWLDRRPKIAQVLDPYNPDVYHKWYICKPSPDAYQNGYLYVGYGHTSLFLHKDGVWRNTTYNVETEQYSGYYDSWEEAHDTLMKKGK